MNESQVDTLLGVLKSQFGDRLISAVNNLGHAEVVIAAESMVDVFEKLKNNAALAFNLLLSVTAVDYLDLDFSDRPQAERFEVVYHLLSLQEKFRLRVKVPVSEDKLEVVSLVALYPGANFMESEVWDMFGIQFAGHPGLTRILMYEEFKGFPLRKDYPVQGKQPRIPLRHPEVENTARLMQRPDLVQINQRKVGGAA